MEAALAVISSMQAFGIFAAFTGLIVILAFWAHRKARENLERFARETGLELIERPPTLGVFRSLPTVEGTRGGRRVRLCQFTVGSGKSRRTYNGIAVSCSNPNGLVLHLSAQNFLTEFAQNFGLQDLNVGDAEFDKRFVVQTNAIEFLSAALVPELRQPLLQYWPTVLGAAVLKLQGDEILWADTAAYSDGKMIERMKVLIDPLVALAALPEVYAGQKA